MIRCLIVVALPAESRGLIDHFRLKAVQHSRYRQYANQRIILVESGMGKLNAASATAATLSSIEAKQTCPPACLNIGIAGADKSIGSLLCAASIKDCASDKTWFPQTTWGPVGELTHVQTVDHPQTNYSQDIAFDMEAAGFVHAAVRFVTLEFIQSIKIVSDNPQNSINNIKPRFVTALVNENLSQLELAIERLIDLNDLLPATRDITELLQSVQDSLGLSVTQESIVHALLHQYRACFQKLPELELLVKQNTAKSLIRFLESNVATAPRHY